MKQKEIKSNEKYSPKELSKRVSGEKKSKVKVIKPRKTKPRTFNIDSVKSNSFYEGKKGTLIGKDGKRIPYNVLSCSKGEGTIMLPLNFLIQII